MAVIVFDFAIFFPFCFGPTKSLGMAAFTALLVGVILELARSFSSAYRLRNSASASDKCLGDDPLDCRL
jgi:hypothetical protein